MGSGACSCGGVSAPVKIPRCPEISTDRAEISTQQSNTGSRMKTYKFTDEQREAILLDYIVGVGVNEIAVRHGCSNNYPTKLARKAGYATRAADYKAKGWRRAFKLQHEVSL